MLFISTTVGTVVPRSYKYSFFFLAKLCVDSNSFKEIVKIYGQVDYYRFADHKNKTANYFNSKYYCPGSKGVDPFTKDWSQSTLNWLCPLKNLLRLC